MDSLPTTENILGPRPTEAKTTEDILGQRPEARQEPSQSGPVNDAFWSWQGNKLGRIMSSFGQGAEHGWGAATEFDKTLDAWFSKDLESKAAQEQKDGIIKAANEAFMRPVVNTLYGAIGHPFITAISHTGLAALSSLQEGGVQIGTEAIKTAQEMAETSKEVEKQTGLPDIAGKAASQALGGAGSMVQAVMSGQYLPGPEVIPPTLTQARAAGAIGEHLDTFLGSKEPTFDEWQGRLRAIADSPGPAAQAAKTDIHEVARMVAPDVFRKWTTLEDNKDILTQHLEGLLKARQELPHLEPDSEALSKLEDKVERLTKKTEGPATPLNREDREALEKAKSDLQTLRETETPAITEARAALAKVNAERNELAPDVKRAYQEAQSRITPQDLSRSSITEEGTVPDTGIPPEAGKPSPIFQSVYDQVLAAGRSTEEATAAATMVQARYETRAKRFGGKLGTAEELYNKDRLSIQSGEGKAPEGEVFSQDEIDNLNNVTDLDTFRAKKQFKEAIDQGAKEMIEEGPKYEGTPEEMYTARYNSFISSSLDTINKAVIHNLPGIAEKWTALKDYVTEVGSRLFHEPTMEEYNEFERLKRKAFDVLNRYKENVKKPGENVVPLKKPEKTLEQKVFEQVEAYHGSPHIYEASEDAPFGQFKNDKIGTGQGVASFGWGHYLAQAAETAKDYVRQLSRGPELRIGDKSVNERNLSMATPGEKTLYEHLKGTGNMLTGPDDILAAEQELANSARYYKDKVQELEEHTFHEKDFSQSQFDVVTRNLDKNKNELLRIEGALKLLRENKDISFTNKAKGSLLKVLIKPDEHELLDHDKRLSEQTPEIKAKLKKLGFEERPSNIDIDRIFGKPLAAFDSDHTNYDIRHPETGKTILVTVDNRSGTTYVMGLHEAGVESKFSSLDAAKKAVLEDIDKDYDPTGEQIYRELTQRAHREKYPASWNDAKKYASEKLHEAGIPGLKYLDQLSRNSAPRETLIFQKLMAEENLKAGYDKELARINEDWPQDIGPVNEKQATEGVKHLQRELDNAKKALERLDNPTRNFVIFDESNLKILDRSLEQEGARANITFQKDGQAIIRLFKTADASSIFHELGHKFLEELKADAEHPEAPEQLRKDWQTVKDFYLRDKNGKPITKKPTDEQWDNFHESWARAFERYLMEGIAPTKELESLFKQLKEWMIKIYHEVTALRAPINDDIRQVMDRLISSDDPAVLTGETTPRAPSPRTKKIITEPEGEAKEVSPEGQPASSVDELPTKGTYLQDDGTWNLEDIDSYPALVKATKEFSELNAQAMNTRKGKLGKADMIEIAQLTSQNPKRIEANLDKMEQWARLDKISPTERVLALGAFLKQNAARIREIIEKANPTSKDMAKFASWVTLHARAIDTMLSTRREWGLTGKALQVLLEDALAEGGDAAFNQSLLQHLGLTAQQLATRMRLFKGAKTTQQVSNMARRITDPSLGKSLVQYYINGLISGPFTHLQYALGNEMTTLKNEILEPGISAAVGGVRAALGNTGERVTANEMIARVYGITYGSRDGLIAAGKAIKEGYQQGFDSDDLILAKVLDEIDKGTTSLANKDARITELTNKVTTFNRLHNVADIQKDEERAVQNLVRVQKGQKAIPARIDPDLKEVFSIIERAEPPQSFYTESREQIASRQGVPGAIQHVINAPGERMVSPIHTVNYIQNLTINLYGKIVRAAFKEGNAKGWTQDQINQKIADMRIDPPLDMIRASREEALSSSLLSKPGDFFSKVNLALSHEFQTLFGIPGFGPTPWLKIAQPFVTISSLVWKGGSILGRYMVPGGILIRKSVRDDMFGKNGKMAQDLAIGKAVAGYGLFWAFWQMSAEGLINQGPADTYQENIYRTMQNGLPYGLHIGDMTYDTEKLGPIGFYSSIVSDLYHLYDHVVDKKEVIPAIEEAMFQMGHHLTNTGPVSGVADLFEAMKEPGRYGQGYLNQLVTAFATPLSVGISQIAHQIDPYQREVTSGGETVTPEMSGYDIFMLSLRNEINRLKKQWVKNIPFASTSLYPQRDLFGQPMPNREFVGVYALAVQKDPVFQSLSKLGYFPAPIPKRIGKFTLTEEMYDKLSAKAGTLAHQLMTQSVSVPNWNQIPPGIQHKILALDVSSARQNARTYLQAEYPDVAKTNAEFKEAITKPLPGEENEPTQ